MSKTKINLKPTNGLVLLKPIQAQQKTKSGIYLPESAEEKPQEGEVLAVGDVEKTEYGAKRQAPCKAGDKVIYKKWGGNEVKVKGKEYLFVKFDDILAIIK